MNIDKCPECGSTDLGTQSCNVCNASLYPRAFDASAGESAQIPPPASEAPPVRLLEDAERKVAAATTPDDKKRAWEIWENALFDYRQRGYRLVTLIGLSDAGKTFFANRLRYELRLRKGWTVDPYEQDTIPRTDGRIESTQIVRNGRRLRRRVLADCDGEAYRDAIQKLLEGSAIPDQLRRYVLITSLASAYVLMVPPPEEEKREKELIDRFGLIVSAILALQRRLRVLGDARAVVQEGLRATDVREAKEHEFISDRPVQVLFSKADRFQTLAPHIGDPLGYAIMRAPQLVRTIDNHFTSYRFDFASAFYGHANGNGEVAHVDYSQYHTGVVPAFDWIDTMVEYPRLWRYGTPAAMWARRMIDGRFRKTGRSFKVW